MNSIDWLIIGGGIHGVHLAARLVGEAKIDSARLKILDPGPRLLHHWRTFSAATGMTHLRSPVVQHLDLEPFSLRRYAGTRRDRAPGVLKGQYDRPSLGIFNAHCDSVIERFGLAGRHLRDQALHIDPSTDGVRVRTCSGESLEAERVLLAIGTSHQPEWPEWAPRNEPRIQHVFDSEQLETKLLGPKLNPTMGPTQGRVQGPAQGPIQDKVKRLLVVGGGISAAQVALRLVAEGHLVDLVSRHPFRVHEFDSSPGWLGPKLMPLFRNERDPDRRRHLIREARHRGSITPELRRSLRFAVTSGKLAAHEGAVSDLQIKEDGLELKLASGRDLHGSRLYLATGFAAYRPGGEMLDQLIEALDLPCAHCGFPIVDPWLRWHPRIHVSGPLAELEIGPVARNIAGARRAGDRLIASIRKQRRVA
ncbi:MAG: FAD/NAD(P)-binding protein [Acidobacteriota bacterium]